MFGPKVTLSSQVVSQVGSQVVSQAGKPDVRKTDTEGAGDDPSVS